MLLAADLLRLEVDPEQEAIAFVSLGGLVRDGEESQRVLQIQEVPHSPRERIFERICRLGAIDADDRTRLARIGIDEHGDGGTLAVGAHREGLEPVRDEKGVEHRGAATVGQVDLRWRELGGGESRGQANPEGQPDPARGRPGPGRTVI
jgi:hypothetical protein